MRSFSVTLVGLSVFSLLVACGDDTNTTGGGGSGTGANNTGAGQTGGNGTGASSTGGNGGAAQGGGGSGGNTTVPAPECTQDSDCFVNSDCCECAGRPLGEAPPACGIVCDVDTCTAKGIDTATAVCAAGRCVTTASCDESTVTCDIPTPQCEAGQSPIVVGACYGGGCLPTLECRDVTSCASCAGANAACVVDSAFTQTSHCVDPQGCNPADCACLGDSVCVGSFNACNDAVDHIECGCPACSQQ